MSHEPIHLMFRRAAEAFGDRTAIEGSWGAVSYRDLDARAADVAARLRAAGVPPGSLVAVFGQDGAEVITAILGVLEAGCAFVPLDPAFPSATLPSILEEVPVRWWLTGTGGEPWLRSVLPMGYEAELIPLPRWDEAVPAPAGRSEPELDPDALAYLYFTSGSTGRPKAIAGRLKAIDHFVRWEIATFEIREGTRVSQLISPAFDAFLRDAFVPLAAGGTVCLPPSRETVLDGAALAAWIDEARVHLIHCTPSVLRTVMAQDLDPSRFPELRRVLLAGEPLLPSDVQRWQAAFGERIELVNLYGPSETTMIKLFYRVQPVDGEAKTIPVGQPMTGARALVVDEKGNPCPPGKLGEIWIRTPYRSLGYHNRPDLTAEVFVRNPWSDKADDLVYKTGDLGRLREDGNLEIVGRRDHQVKVRGVRVELAPIEEALHAHPAVAEAAVADRTDVQGNKFLCAYVVPRSGELLEPEALAAHLQSRLPEPAVPSAFVVLEALPRTLSGKVDRRALPSPAEAGRAGEYVAPSTPVEERLCALFAELLGAPQVGIRDSFFRLGGHSLLATLLLSRIREAFGVEVPLRQVFQTPTVEELAKEITRAQIAQEDQDEMAALLAEIEGVPDMPETLRAGG
jgi:amino acid adenylation domain-containing protein